MRLRRFTIATLMVAVAVAGVDIWALKTVREPYSVPYTVLTSLGLQVGLVGMFSSRGRIRALCVGFEAATAWCALAWLLGLWTRIGPFALPLVELMRFFASIAPTTVVRWIVFRPGGPVLLSSLEFFLAQCTIGILGGSFAGVVMAFARRVRPVVSIGNSLSG